MIKRKTVFILGAGSSCPYDLPSGSELVTAIASGRPAYRALENEYHKIDFERFRSHLLYTRPSSIDDFLRRHSNDYREMGKLAIAAVIAGRSKLPHLIENRNHKGDPPVWDDWHSYLFEIMDVGSLDELLNLQVDFVSFNYDSSFDCALANFITFAFPGDLARKNVAWKKFKPIHLHGSLLHPPEDHIIENNNYFLSGC